MMSILSRHIIYLYYYQMYQGGRKRKFIILLYSASDIQSLIEEKW